tara:strand:+ start:66 stop:629 length:564 start_codon:yes stop_codon:yes gene_type:complete
MEKLIPIIVGLTSYVFTEYIITKKNKPKYAICQLSNNIGYVTFKQLHDNLSEIKCNLKNVSTGLHGLHIHNYGDLTEGCKSTCSHYNPYNKNHGGPLGKNRHRGDLGNIESDTSKNSDTIIHANVNIDEIIGRALILHKNPDDLGQKNTEESKKTGNSGERIACGVIGLAKEFKSVNDETTYNYLVH